ncbi:hypothetical protein PAECIP112173_02338 [Paenibacillus sp. JJ-100]|uniref:hypothetical protein n=1 Tax=Paenibacillus sp. JJ-100 TaxID=2974896 RepID=UPI0022FF760E|nr:hypothetical protein [Paenibacillus sp. JJ-100]CAI6074664.1 hypothetical protein PAECIP112173_02338 [Paenibacillus sp. JJ-100]
MIVEINIIAEVDVLSKARKILSVGLSLVLFLTIVGFQQAKASEVEITPDDQRTNLVESDEFLIKTSEGIKGIEVKTPDGKIEVKRAIVTEYVPVNSSAYLLATGQDPIENDLVKVIDVTYLDEVKNDNWDHEVAPAAIGDLYAKNPSAEYATVDPNYVVASVEETGSSGGTLTLSQSVTVGNSFNTSIGISASVVSATVGYNVSQSWTTTASYSESISKDNHKTVINAYNRYMTRHFEVWKKGLFSDSLQTHSASDRHVGFRFDVLRIPGYPSM